MGSASCAADAGPATRIAAPAKIAVLASRRVMQPPPTLSFLFIGRRRLDAPTPVPTTSEVRVYYSSVSHRAVDRSRALIVLCRLFERAYHVLARDYSYQLVIGPNNRKTAAF